MLDINLLRTNPELVKENIRKKFQDEKLVMVDEVVEMDKEYRAAIQQADTLRNQIKVASKQIGMLMGKGQKEEAEKAKEQVAVYKADLGGPCGEGRRTAGGNPQADARHSEHH